MANSCGHEQTKPESHKTKNNYGHANHSHGKRNKDSHITHREAKPHVHTSKSEGKYKQGMHLTRAEPCIAALAASVCVAGPAEGAARPGFGGRSPSRSVTHAPVDFSHTARSLRAS